MAIDGDTIVVGAFTHDVGGSQRQGAAYIYVNAGMVWTEAAKLTASDGSGHDLFGSSVAIADDTIVVGAPHYNGWQGAAYVFVGSGVSWTEEAKLTASDGEEWDRFGNSVTISENTILVGAPFHEVGGNFRQGAAYVYFRESLTVTIDQSASQADPTNASPIVFDVVFSEDVTGFTGSDVDLSASTAPGTLKSSSGCCATGGAGLWGDAGGFGCAGAGAGGAGAAGAFLAVVCFRRDGCGGLPGGGGARVASGARAFLVGFVPRRNADVSRWKVPLAAGYDEMRHGEHDDFSVAEVHAYWCFIEAELRVLPQSVVWS